MIDIFRLFIVSSNYVQIVYSNGNVDYNDCNYNRGVRPFWAGRRDGVGETPKRESQYQKNKQPFLSRKRQDKYKGMKFYDRR